MLIPKVFWPAESTDRLLGTLSNGVQEGQLCPEALRSYQQSAHTSQRRSMQRNDARLSKGHTESLTVGVADNDSHELRPAPSR